MKTMKNLANMMLISIAAVATITISSCSQDDAIKDEQNTASVPTNNNELLEPVGLACNDFITPTDVTILDADTTQISISKAYADKMGITDFRRAMGILHDFNERSYLVKGVSQELVGDRYIVNVEPAGLADIIQDREVTLQTCLYVEQDQAATRTRAAENNIPEYAAKYMSADGVIHPFAIRVEDASGSTRAFGGDRFFSAEELYNPEYDETRWGLGDLWEAVKNYVNKKTEVTYDRYERNNLINFSGTFEPNPIKIKCGKESDDTITIKAKLPILFQLNYTIDLKASGALLRSPRLDRFEASVDGAFGVAPEVTFGFSKKLELPEDKQKIRLANLGKVSVQFWIYCVPVTIDFIPYPYLKLKAEVEGQVCAGFKYEFLSKFKAGMKYNGSRWSGISDAKIEKNDFDIILPRAEFTAEAGAGLMLGCDVIVCKLAGPTIGVGPQVTANASLAIAPLDDDPIQFQSECKIGVWGDYGVKVKIWEWEVGEWRQEIDFGLTKTLWKYPSDDNNDDNNKSVNRLREWLKTQGKKALGMK